MEKFISKIKMIFTDKSLRNKILFVIFALCIFRVLAAIPIPGIDAIKLARLLENNQFLGVLNIFSGGGLSSLSIIMLGVGPYITSSIIMQLMTIMIPRLKELSQHEGEVGRKKFTQYSRLLTVPLAIVQAVGFIVLLERQDILPALTIFEFITDVSIVAAGSMLLMWIGELVTEYGIGNGISLIIFAGIVAAIPTHISQFLLSFETSQIPYVILFAIVGLLIIAGVVIVTEAERPIPVTYARQARSGGSAYGGGSTTYIPLRINQAGVIPIIFALSILMFPQMLGAFFATSANSILQSISHALIAFVQNPWAYSITYFVLVFLFTFFYTAVTFDPEAMAENLQKNGAFVPGVRPGEPTALFVSKILNRITLMGAAFLGLIAVLPLIMQSLTGITSLAIGGTALLIVVSVVTDLIKKIEAQISMREY
ncbi:MAG: preprotein translocase subunit SecY [Candidatus Paceibacterota bacterium]|jgi:preprotein translocase subunit SecY